MNDTYQNAPIESVYESKTNPRRHFDEAALAELALSVKQVGILQPLVVRSNNQTHPGMLEIVAGARRYRAAKRAGLSQIPVRICEMSDQQVLEVQLIENLLREDVNEIDEPDAINRATLRGAAQMANQMATEFKRVVLPLRKAMEKAIATLHTAAQQLEAALPPESIELKATVDWQPAVLTRGTGDFIGDQYPVTQSGRTPPAPRKHADNAGGAKLPTGEPAVLTACAQYPDGATREQLSILTGYKRSSRDTYIQRLREKGYVDADLRPTKEGAAALGPGFEPLPTGKALQTYWLDRLPEGERKILAVLIAAYPDTISREWIDRHTGYKRSSRDTYIQRLRARQLVEIVGGGLRASEVLFE